MLYNYFSLKNVQFCKDCILTDRANYYQSMTFRENKNNYIYFGVFTFARKFVNKKLWWFHVC